MTKHCGRDGAIHYARNYTEGQSFSDGNIVIGVSDTGDECEQHVAIAFNNTAHNQNQLVVLRAKDALSIHALLHSAMGKGSL